MKVIDAPDFNGVSDEDLYEQFKANATPEEVPERFKTRRQWAEIWGRSKSTAIDAIHRMVAAGVMEQRMFRVLNPSKRRVEPIPHYARVKPSKAH